MRPCIGCAACCYTQAELIGTDSIPAELIRTESERRYMRQKDNACIALDTAAGSCTIYEQRPWICRQFPRGSRACFIAIYDRFGADALSQSL